MHGTVDPIATNLYAVAIHNPVVYFMNITILMVTSYLTLNTWLPRQVQPNTGVWPRNLAIILKLKHHQRTIFGY